MKKKKMKGKKKEEEINNKICPPLYIVIEKQLLKNGRSVLYTTSQGFRVKKRMFT